MKEVGEGGGCRVVRCEHQCSVGRMVSDMDQVKGWEIRTSVVQEPRRR